MADNVLTYPSEFYAENFARTSSIMEEYRKNMLLYVQRLFPEQSELELKQQIDAIIKETYTASTLKYVQSPEPGVINLREDNLLEVTNKFNDYIITPYGAAYDPVAVRRSLFSDYIEDNQGNRKIVKHKMFIADAKGDKNEVQMLNLEQMNIKININVLSGVMLSSVTFRSGINYNAITATSRFNVMAAYSMVELCMASNHYFRSEDAAINWIINVLRVYPGDAAFEACIEQYKLSIPGVETVFEYYREQVINYSPFCQCEEIRKLIYALPQLELAFILYAVNFQKIVQENTSSFLPMFEQMLDLSNVQLVEGDIPPVAKLKDDVLSILTVVMLASDIGKITLDDIDKEHPELARKIYSTYCYLDVQLRSLEPLFKTLIMLPVVASDIGSHNNMIRNMILLSDTDSILFTNVNWISWFSNSIKITDHSTNFNALIVSIISRLLEHMFAYISASMNIDCENMKVIAMKNEFMYDLFLRTPISKHYAGYIKYREGQRQDPYKFDLKGKNFKGSDLCKETTTYVKWFIKYVFDTFLQNYQLDPNDMIAKTIIFEQRIKKSIEQGEVTFLMQKPIQLRQSYKTPESSNYFFYELWQAVFAEKYGDLNPPQKTKELPILEICAQNTHHLNHMKEANPDIHEKLLKFLAQHPKKKISRTLIPMDIPIPEELRSIANYRKVCSANCYSLDLLLRSFNIVNYPNGKSIILFSDTYPQILQEITDEHRERIIREADELFLDEIEEEELHADDGEDWLDETEEEAF